MLTQKRATLLSGTRVVILGQIFKLLGRSERSMRGRATGTGSRSGHDTIVAYIGYINIGHLVFGFLVLALWLS